MLKALVTKLATAIKSEDVRIGRERAEQTGEDRRVVVQFYVGAELYDLFFNARTGAGKLGLSDFAQPDGS